MVQTHNGHIERYNTFAKRSSLKKSVLNNVPQRSSTLLQQSMRVSNASFNEDEEVAVYESTY